MYPNTGLLLRKTSFLPKIPLLPFCLNICLELKTAIFCLALYLLRLYTCLFLLINESQNGPLICPYLLCSQQSPLTYSALRTMEYVSSSQCFLLMTSQLVKKVPMENESSILLALFAQKNFLGQIHFESIFSHGRPHQKRL